MAFFNTLYVGQIQFQDDCPVLNCRNGFGGADPALGLWGDGFVCPIPGRCQLQKPPPSCWNSSALASLGGCSSSWWKFATEGLCNQARSEQAVLIFAALASSRTKLLFPD